MDNAKMMSDAYALRQAIEKEEVAVEENGIKILIGGDLKIKEIALNDKPDDGLKNAINNAIRKAQEMQVKKMNELVDLGNYS